MIPSFISAELDKCRGDHDSHLSLVHGDLTEDHWLLLNKMGRWSISALIDFADAIICPATYEWPALWVGALGRDHDSLHAFMNSYDPNINIDGDFYRHAMAYTFLHEFGVDILEYILPRSSTNDIASIDSLIQLFWMPEN